MKIKKFVPLILAILAVVTNFLAAIITVEPPSTNRIWWIAAFTVLTVFTIVAIFFYQRISDEKEIELYKKILRASQDFKGLQVRFTIFLLKVDNSYPIFYKTLLNYWESNKNKPSVDLPPNLSFISKGIHFSDLKGVSSESQAIVETVLEYSGSILFWKKKEDPNMSYEKLLLLIFSHNKTIQKNLNKFSYDLIVGEKKLMITCYGMKSVITYNNFHFISPLDFANPLKIKDVFLTINIWPNNEEPHMQYLELKDFTLSIGHLITIQVLNLESTDSGLDFTKYVYPDGWTFKVTNIFTCPEHLLKGIA